MSFLAEAILLIRPKAQFVLNGDEYEGLDWKDETQTKPTKQECQSAIEQVRQIHNNNAYKLKRKEAYPSIADQLDTLYHGGYDEWKSQIQAIKDQFPKP